MGFLESLRQEKEARESAKAGRLRQERELEERLRQQEKELHAARRKQAKEFSVESGIGTLIRELRFIIPAEEFPETGSRRSVEWPPVDKDSFCHPLIWGPAVPRDRRDDCDYYYKCIVAETCPDGTIKMHHGTFFKGRAIIQIPRSLWVENKGLLESSLEKAYRRPAIVKTESSFLHDDGPPYDGPCLPGNTLINTPRGLIPIKELKIEDIVWTTDRDDNMIETVIAETSKVPVKITHKMLHIVLSDGREIFVSPGHPDSQGNPLGKQLIGKKLDDSLVISADIIPYKEKYTYDILPSATTGSYWANGILIGSTLAIKYKYEFNLLGI